MKKNAPGSTRRHAKYRKLLKEYAKQYGTTDRAIKRWIHVGKKHGELPPLGKPERMLSWYQGNHVRVTKAVVRNIGLYFQTEFELHLSQIERLAKIASSKQSF